MAGAIPGVLIAIGLMIANYFVARKLGIKGEGEFRLKELAVSFVDSIWALLAPFIVVPLYFGNTSAGRNVAISGT